MKKLDLNNKNHQLIVAALAGLVEDDGYTPHEAFELLDDVKRNLFHALAEIARESRNRS